MDWQTIITIIISSGIVAALTSGILTHFSNKKLDMQQRTMEIRKELYTKITNQLALFLNTVSETESDNARYDLLKYFREIQIWGSDEVARNFKKLLDLMADKNSSQDKRNLQYKDFIVTMRKDILGKTSLNPEDIDIRGLLKK